jgi:hypothetical protein
VSRDFVLADPESGGRWPIAYEELLEELRDRNWPVFPAGDKSIKTFCPICENERSNSPSLSISRGRNGQALLYCFNALVCGLDRSASARQLAAVIDAFATATPPVAAGRLYHRRTTGGPGGWFGDGEIIARYEYGDGRHKVRIKHGSWDKDFRWPEGKGRPQLYRPPTPDDPEPVFLCEGEKDVDNLRTRGLTATTVSEGYLKPELAEPLRNRYVAALADHDDHGFRARDEALRVLRGVARWAAWVDLGLEYRQRGGLDVSNWFEAGGTAEALIELARTAFILPNPSDPT